MRGFREKKYRGWSVFSVVEESVWKGVVSGFLHATCQFIVVFFYFFDFFLIFF